MSADGAASPQLFARLAAPALLYVSREVAPRDKPVATNLPGVEATVVDLDAKRVGLHFGDLGCLRERQVIGQAHSTTIWPR